QYGPTHLFADLAPRRNTTGLVLLLEGCAALAMMLGYECRATRLCAAASAVRERERVPFYFPVEHSRVRATIAQARLNLEPAEFEQQWNAGCALSLEAAVAEALELTTLVTV
ncbi:MAG TPA: hypothetical protein VFT99_08825, partial [Roseiflexaceae bacterium]|nr:hypothetical protein [Roseiflexaceae bacterium]